MQQLLKCKICGNNFANYTLCSCLISTCQINTMVYLTQIEWMPLHINRQISKQLCILFYWHFHKARCPYKKFSLSLTNVTHLLFSQTFIIKHNSGRIKFDMVHHVYGSYRMKTCTITGFLCQVNPHKSENSQYNLILFQLLRLL